MVQITGLAIAVVFFALMRQAYAWELDMPIPSMLSAVELNLRILLPFLVLGILPILVALFFSFSSSFSVPPFSSFFIVSIICYLFANGAIIVLVLISQLGFYIAATIHVFIKKRLVVSSSFWFVYLLWYVFGNYSVVSENILSEKRKKTYEPVIGNLCVVILFQLVDP